MRPRYTPPTGWTPPDLASLPSWSRCPRVGIDTETKDPNLREDGPGDLRGDGHVAGYCVALDDGPDLYLPVGHEAGGNLDREVVERYLADQLRDYRGEIVGANLPYELGWWASRGLVFHDDVTFHDVLLADTLIDENQLRYNLDAVAMRHGLPPKNEAVLRFLAAAWGVDPKAELWKLPASAVGRYGERDARLPLQILERQLPLIEAEGTMRCYRQEAALLPVLHAMRQRGVRVDLDRLDTFDRELGAKVDECLRIVHHHTGIQLAPADLNASAAQVPVLEKLGVPVPMTPKSNKPSVTNEALGTVDHPAAAALLAARKALKVRGTFVEGHRHYLIGDRVHPAYNQSKRERSDQDSGLEGAGYGRLSCTSPNIQQAPTRDFPEWRTIYVTDNGEPWGKWDYSQQEPRITADYAERVPFSRIAGLCRTAEDRALARRAEETARAAADAYRNDPNCDNHQMFADLIGWEGKEGRSRAKNIFLGLCYGMGPGKLARSLGLPTVTKTRRGREWETAGPEAAAILADFEAGAPHLRMLARACEISAREKGYIMTNDGRKCRFPRGPDGRLMFTHKAMNRLIQGSAAGITRRALVALHRAGYPTLVTVHDEVDGPVRQPSDLDIVREIMVEAAADWRVPHKVDPESGPSWGAVTA